MSFKPCNGTKFVFNLVAVMELKQKNA